MLKKTKIKKFNLFKKLIFTILFGISSVCLLGGWTIDSNGNLQSDNMFNFEEFKSKTTTITRGTVNWLSNGFTLTATDDDCFTRSAEGLSSYYNEVLANTKYTISLNANISGSGYSVIIFYRDSNGSSLSFNAQYNTTSFTFTTPNNCKYINIRFGVNSNNDVCTFTNIMFNEGLTALPYEPYGTWYSQANYEMLENDISELNDEIGELEEQVSDLQDSLEQLQQEYEDYQELISNTMGTTSFDISQYSVSVGRVPNQPSFDYTLDRNITINFSTIGYLNVSDIYSTYIYNNGQINNNNSIYITTPQSNLLTFDMTFNYTTQPNTMIKTTLTLPNGDLQQFAYSSTDFNYKGEWTLANLVASSTIGENYDINDISYKDVIITYENVGNNLSDIKLGSNNGYNTGFNSGYNTALDRINELTNELNTKTAQLEQTTTDLYAKTIQYEHLYTRFQQLSDRPLQLNFQTLLWNIASTPFETFKTMWNFNFLGFNIAQFVTR